MLTLCLFRALRGRAALAALLVFVALATDEYFQRFSGHRTSDWNDLFADIVGIAVAVTMSKRG